MSSISSRIRDFLKRVQCMFVCCSSKLVINKDSVNVNDEQDGAPTTETETERSTEESETQDFELIELEE